jgi:glycosyltransferase involved in cell wall biosynthesis
MSRLHVLLTPAYYPAPENPVAGPFMRDLAQAISLQNRVTVLAPPSAASSRDIVVDGIRTIRFDEPLRQGRVATIQRIISINATISKLRREGTPVDILHAHNLLTGAVAVLVGRARRLPVVITENLSRSLTGELSGYEMRLARFAYRRASVVCPDSPLTEVRLRVLQPRGRYEVVPEVVDVDLFATVQLDRQTAVPQVVAVANLVRRKGLDYLIEAVRLLIGEGRDLALTVVGEGPERHTLEAQAAGMPVRLVGSYSREKILELLGRADVFAMPTLADPFGIAPVEALAARVPVVITSAAGSAALLGPLGAKIIPPGDSIALRDALAECLDTPNSVSPDAVDALRGYCSPKAVGERLDEIYRLI